jgi:hypothetical protein
MRDGFFETMLKMIKEKRAFGPLNYLQFLSGGTEDGVPAKIVTNK